MVREGDVVAVVGGDDPVVGLQDIVLPAPLVDLLAGYGDFAAGADCGDGGEGGEEEEGGG